MTRSRGVVRLRTRRLRWGGKAPPAGSTVATIRKGGRPLSLEAYFPVLLFIIVGVGLGLALMTIGRVLGLNNPDPDKLLPYERGFEAFEDARMKFDVCYYLIAILFILSDLETAFLFPWGVALHETGWPGSFAVGVFLLELLVGFVYIWKKGALDWE